MNLWL